MKTGSVAPADLTSSIIALPPLARTKTGAINEAENAKIIAWLCSARVSTFMYGGVANLFNAALSEYGAVLDLIEKIAPAEAWVVPAIGGDYGKATDQIEILRAREFPTAILLPFAPIQAKGVATGLRRLSDRYGRPLMVFFKSADYLEPADIAALLADGVLCCVEYGVPANERGESPHLAELLERTGGAERIIDGSGEKTIVANAAFGIRGYTSGSGVIAPHLSMAVLDAVKQGDLQLATMLSGEFKPFDALRGLYSPISVVHDAVRLAGIADTGPIGPFFQSIADPAVVEEITTCALALKETSVLHAARQSDVVPQPKAGHPFEIFSRR
jgi:4-hydroxy-tetrahydrodipicolinate synthase